MLPLTETNNLATREIDQQSTEGMLRLINEQDQGVPAAVAAELQEITRAVDAIYQRIENGGRLIYIGAGTSGRLGVVDASEMPPTYGTPPELVVGVIAGSERAMFESVEGAEDRPELGAQDMEGLNVNGQDAVLGIAASGRTPYVIGALQEAKRRGALTVSLACSRPAPIQEVAEINIAALTGPEVVEGSTRMKAGTATKLVLNMISTALMIKLGKTYGNLMVDVQTSNQKLRERAQRIVERVTGLTPDEAQTLLERSGEVKTALVAHLAQVTPEEARGRLARAGGRVRSAVKADNGGY